MYILLLSNNDDKDYNDMCADNYVHIIEMCL